MKGGKALLLHCLKCGAMIRVYRLPGDYVFPGARARCLFCKRKVTVVEEIE